MCTFVFVCDYSNNVIAINHMSIFPLGTLWKCRVGGPPIMGSAHVVVIFMHTLQSMDHVKGRLLSECAGGLKLYNSGWKMTLNVSIATFLSEL